MASASTIKPFAIAVSDEQLSTLKKKLELTRFPDELENVDWDYGVPLCEVKRLVAYWQNGYDWRKHEAEFNRSLPQFTIDIPVDGFETLNIHFIHQKSNAKNAIPLLFVHGWPGSFIEVSRILPLLNVEQSDDAPSFHVVSFSLPGYGFSEATKKKRFDLDQYAEVGHKLMLALGYETYVTQGGDWGAWITRRMADVYGGKYIKAMHTNMIPIAPPQPFKHPLLYLKNVFPNVFYTEREREDLRRSEDFMEHGRGYSHQQSTRPQTLGYSLADSPAGLLAWIYDKMHTWSDNYPWTDDEILTWISVYWFSRAGPTASTRIYYEFQNFELLRKIYHERMPIQSKGIVLGYSWFPNEIHASPPAWTRMLGNVVFTSVHDKGGHFAAYEKPEALVADLRKMFGKGGGAYGVIKP